MNYHNILHDNMLNGDGLRVVLFVSGCEHHCIGCHNKETWKCDSGIRFDDSAKQEIFEQLSKDYIDGITFSGGDPLHPNNISHVKNLIGEIREKFPTKTIWLYTGYTMDEISNDTKISSFQILKDLDVLVDGKFDKDLLSPEASWIGSSNQTVWRFKDLLE